MVVVTPIMVMMMPTPLVMMLRIAVVPVAVVMLMTTLVRVMMVVVMSPMLVSVFVGLPVRVQVSSVLHVTVERGLSRG